MFGLGAAVASYEDVEAFVGGDEAEAEGGEGSVGGFEKGEEVGGRLTPCSGLRHIRARNRSRRP